MIVDGLRYNLRVAIKELPVLRQRGVCCGLPDVDEDWAERTSTLMKALADPTRLTMVASTLPCFSSRNIAARDDAVSAVSLPE